MDAFYSLLESTIKTIAKRDIVVIQGDWNSKIGIDAYQQRPGTTGKHGVGTTNEGGGLHLLEFARMHNLVIANTRFKHKTSRRIAWTAPDGVARTRLTTS